MNHAAAHPLPETLLQQEISLYQELLDCLEQEAQALGTAQEEKILSLAATKEKILERLQEVKQAREKNPPNPENNAALQELARVQRQVATRNLRNREIIAASLEVIQEFLNQFLPPGPGLYKQEGKVDRGSGRTLFHRQA